MLVYKHRGFVSPDINETLGIKKVELVSTGRNNPGTSLALIDGEVIATSTNRGITVIVLNEDWTTSTIQRFDVVGNDTAKINFANFIYNRDPNKIFLIITNDSINTNPMMSAAMASFGAVRFLEIPFDPSYNTVDGREYNKRIPYCAIAGSEVGIIYESLGSGFVNASVPNASIKAMLPELKYFGCQGFGRNLSEISKFESGGYRYFNIRPMDEPANQFYKISYFHKLQNQNDSLSKGAWVRVDLIDPENTTILDTVYNKYIVSNQWKREVAYFPPLTNNNFYRVSIVADVDLSFPVIDRISITKAGVHHPYYEDNHFARITDKGYISALHLRNSMFGAEPYYGDSIRGTYESSQQLFDDDVNVAVYENDGSLGKGKLINSQSESALVELNDTDIGMFANCIVYSNSTFQPKITTTIYDADMNVLLDTLHINHDVDVPANKHLFLEWYIFKPEIQDYASYIRIQNIRYGDGRGDYGYSSLPTINGVLEMPVDAKFIKYTFDKNDTNVNDYYIVYPCASTIIPMAGKEGYLSPTNFNMGIPPLPPATGLLFETSLITSFYRQGIGAPTPEKILSEWARANDTTYFANPNDATGASSAWYYDPSTNSFVNSQNSGPYIQILSPDKTENFEFESTVTSSSSDNDTIGLVAAANFENGNYSVVMVACNAGGIGPAKGFSLFYMSSQNGTQVLAQSLPFSSTGQGWSGRSLRVKIIREGDSITAMSSDWNGTALKEDRAISMDLTSLNDSLLTKPASYGFFAKSQAQSTFLDYQISGSGVYDRSTLYDGETLEKYTFTDGVWENTGNLITSDITPPRQVLNPITKELYSLSFNSALLIEENGIVGEIPDIAISENTTITISITDILAYYTYGSQTLTLKSVPYTNNCDVSVIGNDVNITSNTGNGLFYLYIEAADGTIGFKQYNLIVT